MSMLPEVVESIKDYAAYVEPDSEEICQECAFLARCINGEDSVDYRCDALGFYVSPLARCRYFEPHKGTK